MTDPDLRRSRAALRAELEDLLRVHNRPYEEGGCQGECVTCQLLRDLLPLLEEREEDEERRTKS